MRRAVLCAHGYTIATPNAIEHVLISCDLFSLDLFECVFFILSFPFARKKNSCGTHRELSYAHGHIARSEQYCSQE